MSLDVSLSKTMYTTVFSANITHNLNKMASHAMIYKHLWRPEEIGISSARQLIVPLEMAVSRMKQFPSEYKKFDSENGWGTYESFLPWIEKYLEACKEHPEADVSVSR